MRLYQDDNFVFTGFDGLILEKLLVCENPETNEPLIVYIKVEKNCWHRFFLDAGFGFWENWGDSVNEDVAYNYIDKTTELGLLNQKISKIYCQPQKNNCQIIIEFQKAGKLILQSIDPAVFDSKCEIKLLSH